jgi:hypothetical protein
MTLAAAADETCGWPGGERPARSGTVVTYARPGEAEGHDAKTRAAMAQRLSKLKGFAFGGEYDALGNYGGPVYFVPGETLIGVAHAASLGVRNEDHLFGGVVPHAFVATKAITHPLFGAAATAPEGWRPEFGERVADFVLDGYSAFSGDDALQAGMSLLDSGPVRVKRTVGIGGRGQFVVRSVDELQQVLSRIDPDELAMSGVVIEQNLVEVTTHSIGQVRVAGMVATYCGSQRLTTNNRGAEVYGGSQLLVARGGFDALLDLPVPDAVLLAISQAHAYDEAANACFAGFFASRCNYDVSQGLDALGRERSGVLEQSWRIGGASGAEIAALEAFRDDPALQAVRAVTMEVYGDSPPPPEDAVVSFRGVDPAVGPLTKYSRVVRDGDAR